MKRIFLLLAVSICLWAACTTIPKMDEAHFFPLAEDDLNAGAKSLHPRLPASLSSLPDHIIDDFEQGTVRCRTSASELSRITLKEEQGDPERPTSICFDYSLPSREARFLIPDRAGIILNRDTEFEKYNGIQFYARAENNFSLKIHLVERNNLEDNIQAVELWTCTIPLTRKWELYQLDFRIFQSEEYFEQSFIGDEFMNLERIRRVGFMVDNSLRLSSNEGSVFLDDVILY